MIRKALLSKYRRYTNSGYEVLYPRPPVIYYCDMQGQGIGKHVSYLCAQVRTSSVTFNSVYFIDTSQNIE